MAYELLPFIQMPERAEIIADALRKTALTPTIFSEAPCPHGCIEAGVRLPEMCRVCAYKMQQLAIILGASDTAAFEVWNEDVLVGLVFFTDVTAIDAVGHYVFFDRNLADKTVVLEEAIAGMFEAGLRRLTVEIPSPFASLIRHASRKLGFGGTFTHETRKKDGSVSRVRVEGVKRGAAMYDGRMVDLLILGRSAPASGA